MAVKKITPGIDDTTLSVTVNREYKDVDLKFTAKPGSEYDGNGNLRGDVYRKFEVRAIEQSVNNILLTNHFEKPFQPLFGADLSRLLFELNTEISETVTTRIIKNQIEKHEPRVEVLNVDIYDSEEDLVVPKGASSVFTHLSGTTTDRYHLIVYVHCKIINTGQEIRIPVNMNRLR